MGATIVGKRQLYKGWLTLTETLIRLPDGTEFKREVEHHGRAAAVLPYDPVRRTAVLVSLLRAAPLLSGITGEMLEAPAGIMDEDEPEETARREVLEETGLQLDELEPVATAWPMPGISTETIALFLAPYAEGSKVGEGGGLASEHENITVVEKTLQDIWAATQTGKIADLKTVFLVYALRHRRPELFD